MNDFIYDDNISYLNNFDRWYMADTISKTYDWLTPLDLQPYEVNNLHQICIAIIGGSGQYTGDIYDPKITRADILQEEE